MKKFLVVFAPVFKHSPSMRYSRTTSLRFGARITHLARLKSAYKQLTRTKYTCRIFAFPAHVIQGYLWNIYSPVNKTPAHA